MRQYLRDTTLAATAGFALVVLAACTSAGRIGASSAELAALSEQAMTLSQSGDHSAARQVYLSLERRAPAQLRQQYRILAAREAGREGRHRRALSELQAIQPQPRWSALWALAAAESEREVTGVQAAYNLLAGIDPEGFSELAPELLRTRSNFLFALQRPADALRELTLLGAGFSSSDVQTAGLTWSLLRDYRSQLTTEGVEGVPLGWIELALLFDDLEQDPTETRAGLEDWRTRHPGHPAIALLGTTVAPEVCQSMKLPSRIAMLLPGSDRDTKRRQSLRDGFLTARFALKSSCNVPEVAFYEIASIEDAQLEWTRAAADGAEFIVGPLLPEAVENVARVAGALPTLALNRLRSGAPPAAFDEFALAPEHEAQQAAREALRRGMGRALVLFPGTDWGRRIYRSFEVEFEAGGGEIIAREQYGLADVDYSDQIGRLLKTGASSRRHQQLQRRLGTRLAFQPRRREDADLVFVVARSAQGQLLVPQLRYNYSADLPVFSIQSIFDPQHPDNRDLNGVEIPALPVLAENHVQLLHGELSHSWLAASEFNVPLFAMGYDSFKLALALYRGRDSMEKGIHGLTGMVYRSADGQLERELVWTRIEDGQLKTTD